MLLSAEQWRKDFGVEKIMKYVLRVSLSNILSDLAPTNREFDFKEKALVDKFYPQFYHKMDKVCENTVNSVAI